MFFVTAKNASYQIACGKKGKGASSPTELTPLLHEISRHEFGLDWIEC